MDKDKKIFYTHQRSGRIRHKGFGLIHVYYGTGVGKTTRAVGLAVRAAGAGKQVDFIQFMKSGTSGEVTVFNQVENLRYWCYGDHPFIMSSGPDPVHHEHAERALEYAFQAVEDGSELLLCDEILDTLLFGLLEIADIVRLVKTCKRQVELIMTGRHVPWEVFELADYATELVQRKHPYYQGFRAREGIEF
jgi:cob(I)alamin adenosyltransferase